MRFVKDLIGTLVFSFDMPNRRVGRNRTSDNDNIFFFFCSSRHSCRQHITI